MTLHNLVFRDGEQISPTVLDEGTPFTISVSPIITADFRGITVGLLHWTQNKFAYWYSEEPCDIFTAWRVCRLLRRLRQLRNQADRYDATLSGLVVAMNGDRNENRMRQRARDLGMTTTEFAAELKRLNGLWPSSLELSHFWNKLPESEQNKLPGILRQAIEANHVITSPRLVAQIESAERRLDDAAAQREHEDQLIEDGLDPKFSLSRLLRDLGMTSLIRPYGSERSKSTYNNLDREIMSQLIGSRGNSSRLPLVARAGGPVDPAVFIMKHIPGTAYFWIASGDYGYPRILLDDAPMALPYVGWDRTTEGFVLTVRPEPYLNGDDDSQDSFMSIPELRARIGESTGLDGPLLPGTEPLWLKPSLARGLWMLRRSDRRKP
jgi:hypothetical protein